MDAINHNKYESFNITIEAVELGRYQATAYDLSSEKKLKIEFDLIPENGQDILYMLDPLNAENIPDDELTKLGSRFFQELFGDNIIGKEYRIRVRDAHHRNIDLQICLDIKPSELEALPREYLIKTMPMVPNLTNQDNHIRDVINVGSIRGSKAIAIGKNSKAIALSFNLPDLNSLIKAPREPRQMPTIEDFIGRKTEIACYKKKLNKLNFAIIAGMAGVGKTALTIQLAEQFMGAKLAEINVSTDVIRRNTFWHNFLKDGKNLDGLMTSLVRFLYVHGNEQLWKLMQANEREINIKSELIYALSKQPFLLCLDNFPTFWPFAQKKV